MATGMSGTMMGGAGMMRNMTGGTSWLMAGFAFAILAAGVAFLIAGLRRGSSLK